jgi:NAD(P)-dependent dehydrogenase (short-subunit alcohol dehydrogenase family)
VAADYKKLIADLLAFYNFKDRTVLAVGAGGGQLIEYGRAAARVLALDNDALALDKLRENLKAAGLENKFSPLLGDFYAVDLKADVVLFEFCLHEMSDPGAAVERARGLAPDVVVLNHWPGSEWSFIAAEEDKVAASWGSLVRFPVKKTRSYADAQSFNDYEELYQKVKGQGETSLRRIEMYRGRTGIRIPMSYGLALIEGCGG